MQKQMIPDPIHTLLHMVNGLSNEKVTQNFRNKKIRETYPKKKNKTIQAGKKFQKAILHDPLTFCLLGNQKKNQKKNTPNPPTCLHLLPPSLPPPKPPPKPPPHSRITLPLPIPSLLYHSHSIPFRFTTSTRRAKLFGVKAGKLFSSVSR